MAALNQSSNLVAWVWLRFHKDLPLAAVLEKTNQVSGRGRSEKTREGAMAGIEIQVEKVGREKWLDSGYTRENQVKLPFS